MYIVLAIILVGIMFVGIFVIGAMFSRHILLDALEDARHDQLRQEYYRMAGVRTPTDPKPYVPPRIRPVAPQTRRFIPCMSKLDRLLREGKRGTIMVRAGDRNKKAG